MAITQFVVLRHEKEWKISFEGTRFGPYASEQAAKDVAVASAYAAGKKGRDARVVVQGGDHRFRTEWTYGRDPNPPFG